MVSKPEDFPRTLTPKERLQAKIEAGLKSRRASGRLQFLVTAPRSLLLEVLREYKAAGWVVRCKRHMSPNQTESYMLKFSRP